MPITLQHSNRRVQQGGNDGEIGTLDHEIGNAAHGQMVFLSGQEKVLQVVPVGYTVSNIVLVDTLVYTGPALLHQILISEFDAAPSAGTIIIFDSVTEAGKQVFNWTLTTGVFNPIVIPMDIQMTTGIFIGFTTTADVNVSVSYLPGDYRLA